MLEGAQKAFIPGFSPPFLQATLHSNYPPNPCILEKESIYFKEL